MWGYSYTTTDKKYVIVTFNGENTGDVTTMVIDDYFSKHNVDHTYGNKLQRKRY